MSKTACLPVAANSLTPAGTPFRSSNSVRRSSNAVRHSSTPRSAAVSGVRSGLAFAAASVASTAREEISRSENNRIYANEIETTLEMPREIVDTELAPLPAAPAIRRPMTTRSLITPDVAASAVASAAAAAVAAIAAAGNVENVPTTTVEVVPAPLQVVPQAHRSLSPIKSAPVLAVQGFGLLTPATVSAEAAAAQQQTRQRSAAMREAFVAFGSFACVGAVAALLASGLLNFSASAVSAKEAAAAAVPGRVVTAPAAKAAKTTLKTATKSAIVIAPSATRR